jgi:hypothetical protein
MRCLNELVNMDHIVDNLQDDLDVVRRKNANLRDDNVKLRSTVSMQEKVIGSLRGKQGDALVSRLSTAISAVIANNIIENPANSSADTEHEPLDTALHAGLEDDIQRMLNEELKKVTANLQGQMESQLAVRRKQLQDRAEVERARVIALEKKLKAMEMKSALKDDLIAQFTSLSVSENADGGRLEPSKEWRRPHHVVHAHALPSLVGVLLPKRRLEHEPSRTKGLTPLSDPWKAAVQSVVDSYHWAL